MKYWEISPFTYFWTKGELGVYVHNRLGKRENVHDEIEIEEIKFQSLKASSSVNFITSYLQQESLFTIRAEEDTEIIILKREDLVEISTEDEVLLNILSQLNSKYQLCGAKYDFDTPNYTKIKIKKESIIVKKIPRQSWFNTNKPLKQLTMNTTKRKKRINVRYSLYHQQSDLFRILLKNEISKYPYGINLTIK